MENPLLYKIALSLIPHIGSITAKKLIAYTGSIEAIFSEKKKNLLKIPGIGEFIADKIIHNTALKTAEKELKFIEQNNIKVLFYLDPEYPDRLKQCEDCPIILFIKGNYNFQYDKLISIVGTRNATDYGTGFCKQLIEDIANNNYRVAIVSGLAYGIDIAAHKAALNNHLPTIAVLAHGLQTIYPAVHKKYATKIIEHNGSLITDFTSQCSIDRTNFIKRNRIIAGMSDATIVVESGEKGGALVTADIAGSYNRDVFAVPGRITDIYSTGCNKLIKTNKATIIENLTDLEYHLGWDTPPRRQAFQKQLFIELSPQEQKIIEILKNQDLSIDQLCREMQQPTSIISPLLLNLEFSGLIKSLPGKIYKLS